MNGASTTICDGRDALVVPGDTEEALCEQNKGIILHKHEDRKYCMTDDEYVVSRSCAYETKNESQLKIDRKQVFVIALDAPGDVDDVKGELNERVILHEHEEGKYCMTGDEDISYADGTKDGLCVKIDGRKVLVITPDAPGNTYETIDKVNEGVILHEHPNKMNIVDKKRIVFSNVL